MDSWDGERQEERWNKWVPKAFRGTMRNERGGDGAFGRRRRDRSENNLSEEREEPRIRKSDCYPASITAVYDTNV